MAADETRAEVTEEAAETADEVPAATEVARLVTTVSIRARKSPLDPKWSRAGRRSGPYEEVPAAAEDEATVDATMGPVADVPVEATEAALEVTPTHDVLEDREEGAMLAFGHLRRCGALG